LEEERGERSESRPSSSTGMFSQATVRKREKIGEGDASPGGISIPRCRCEPRLQDFLASREKERKKGEDGERGGPYRRPSPERAKKTELSIQNRPSTSTIKSKGERNEGKRPNSDLWPLVSKEKLHPESHDLYQQKKKE